MIPWRNAVFRSCCFAILEGFALWRFFGYQNEKTRVPISSFQIIFVNFKGAHSQGWHTDRQWALVYSKELMQLCRTCSFEKFETNYLIVAVATGVSPSTLLEKNPKKLSQHKFIGGEEWKSYINNIWLNSNPSTNIHWSVNFRRFFVNVFLLLKIWFESMHFFERQITYMAKFKNFWKRGFAWFFNFSMFAY